ncbi:MAG: dTDP-4-dehydrorhamnose reductase [Chitinivibrionales bacterium]|nr:dTDP-4-dehydrorhamnose reductase [Chitinivibrionales bacterium]
MKIVIIGCNGQLGTDLTTLLHSTNHTVSAIDYPQIDLTDRNRTTDFILQSDAECIVNCAAYTDVDGCETNKQQAYKVNAEAVGIIAQAAEKINATVVHFSTDFVFDGLKTTPYVESDIPHPQSIYGLSKLKGERMCIAAASRYFILRVAWLYSCHGSNFVKKIKAVAEKMHEEKKPMHVVNDQWGNPTYTKAVCRQLMKLLESPDAEYGIYHCTNPGVCSRFEFAQHILDRFSITTELQACTTDQYPYPQAAMRPRYSALENHALKTLNIHEMPLWQESFEEFFSDLG